MLLTINKRWNYFITLPPAAREYALPVSLPSPMRRRLRYNVIVTVIVVVVVVNRAVAINIVVVAVVVVVHCPIAVDSITVVSGRGATTLRTMPPLSLSFRCRRRRHRRMWVQFFCFY